MSISQDWQVNGQRQRTASQPLYRMAQHDVAPPALPASFRGEPVGARRWAEVTQLRGGLRRDGQQVSQPIMLLLLSLFSLLVLVGSVGANSAIVRSIRDPLGELRSVLRGPEALPALADAPPVGEHSVRAAPSLNAAQIDRVLERYGSPAAGTGDIWYRLGVERGIDPAYAIAFFIHESGAGTSDYWAGNKPDGSTTHNVGNIICAGYATCYGRFRDYPDWASGIADWYRLIDVEYLQWRGLLTVAEIIPVYAPSVENNVQLYVSTVENLVDEWRTNGVR